MEKQQNENKIHVAAYEAFDEKYSDFLRELAAMPCDTPQEKEARYSWFRDLKEKDAITVEVLKTVAAKAHGYDAVIAEGEFSKDVDSLVLMECLRATIMTYKHQNNGGESMPFLGCIKANYKRMAGREANKAVLKRQGISVDRPERSRAEIGKLVRAIQKEGRINWKSLEHLIEEKAKEITPKSGYKYTKMDLQVVKEIMEKMNFVSLDQKMNEDEGEERETLGDYIPTSDQKFYEGQDTYMADFLENLAESLDSNYKVLYNSLGKVNLDILKAMITKDILIAMKLVTIPEGNKTLIPEPKCGQWCNRSYKYQNKKRCPYDDFKGCFVRYDQIQNCPPYGDEEIYGLLEPVGKLLYAKLLHKKYLDVALRHRNLEDVYQNKLYPHPSKVEEAEKEQCFDFSDTTLARALGKDKGQISNSRKKYENESRPFLYQMCSTEA